MYIYANCMYFICWEQWQRLTWFQSHSNSMDLVLGSDSTLIRKSRASKHPLTHHLFPLHCSLLLRHCHLVQWQTSFKLITMLILQRFVGIPRDGWAINIACMLLVHVACSHPFMLCHWERGLLFMCIVLYLTSSYLLMRRGLVEGIFHWDVLKGWGNA